MLLLAENVSRRVRRGGVQVGCEVRGREVSVAGRGGEVHTDDDEKGSESRGRHGG